MNLTNGRVIFHRFVDPVPYPILFQRIGRERDVMKSFKDGKINARIARSVLAKCAVSRQGIVPAKEDKPRLRLCANQAVQHSRNDERQSDREQILGVGEDSAQAINFDRVCLDDAIEKK